MTKADIWRLAKEQSARDLGADPSDFDKTEPILYTGTPSSGAKRYYKPPICANLITYGSNVVALTTPENRALIEEYVKRFPFYHCFETPNLYWLSERLAALGQKVCYMAEYFLPDPVGIPALSCPYETRLLGPSDFSSLYLPTWGNALCAARKELDVLGVGAYDGDALVGLAACSADAEDMWQIGVDVLSTYRNVGVASALTSRLAKEILLRGKIPFYCCAWSNVPSARNAVKCGFSPAWAELTVKPAATVDKANEET